MTTRSGPRTRLMIILAAILAAISTTTSGCGGSASATIMEAGSTTVQPLAERLAEGFKVRVPGVEVIIQGGGSSVGIASAQSGTVDIGASSRELQPSEPGLVKSLVARDGIAIITWPGNTIGGLAKEQMRDIFSGALTNWNQVGGPDRAIYVMAREEGSGTRTAFEEMVMGDALITSSAILLPFNGALRLSVAGTPGSIGFISFGYLDPSVKALDLDGTAATETHAADGSYPLVRPLYFLTREQPAGLVREFIEFCLGPEGQAIVAAEGYLAVA